MYKTIFKIQTILICILLFVTGCKGNTKENSLISIEISPIENFLYLTDTQQYTAIGIYKDKSTQDLTSSVIWYSSNPNVAIIFPFTGLLTALGGGITQITAIMGAIRSNEVILNVQNQATPPVPKITKIEISGSNTDILINDKQNFVATAVYSDQSTENVTSKVKWGSSIPTVASIDHNGTTLGMSPGTTQISAIIDTIISNKISLNVNIKYFSLLESSVAGIAIGSDENIWYVQSDRINPSGNNIIRQTLDGKITKFPLNPKSPSDIPRLILSGIDGNLWFNMGSKMIKMTLSGIMTEYELGVVPYSLSMSSSGHIVIGSSETIVITANGEITKYKVSSDYTKTAMDKMGTIWSVRGYGKYIEQLKPGYNPLVTRYPLPTWSEISSSSSFAIISSDDGNIWFTENANKLAKISDQGVITEFQVPNVSATNSMLSDQHGNLWFLAYGKIIRVTTNGSFTEYPLGDNMNGNTVIAIENGKVWYKADYNKIGLFILPSGI